MTVNKGLRNIIALDTIRVVLLMKISRKTIAVILVDTVFRTYPYIASLILVNRRNLTARQFV